MKTVTLKLVGLDSNIFNLAAAFKQQARVEGWTPEEIKDVTDKVFHSPDYDSALAILSAYCKEP